MADNTANLAMPYILAAQAQKHVTHNDALRLACSCTPALLHGSGWSLRIPKFSVLRFTLWMAQFIHRPADTASAKPKYWVTNWRDYNRALVSRGQVTLWTFAAVLAGWRATGGKGKRTSAAAIPPRKGAAISPPRGANDPPQTPRHSPPPRHRPAVTRSAA